MRIPDRTASTRALRSLIGGRFCISTEANVSVAMTVTPTNMKKMSTKPSTAPESRRLDSGRS